MKQKCRLWLRDLELSVNLGWPEEERHEAQIIGLDVEIYFPQPPRACISDQLDDTICYASCIAELKQQLAGKHYKLVEHLSHDIYTALKSLLPTETKVVLHVAKHPQIDGLTGGICFSYGDEHTEW